MCLGLIFKQALHRMALMLFHWEKHFPAEVLNTVEVMRREMRPRRLSPILPKQAFLHNTFLCLSSLTLNYSNCGHPWSNLFRNQNLNEPSVHRTNPSGELHVLIWGGIWAMEYKLFMASPRVWEWPCDLSWGSQLKANQLTMGAFISP